MKILLVRPPAPNKLSFTGVLDNEPLELEYLHTVLSQNGYEDYIFDSLVEQESFINILKRECPDVVAITGYISQENVMIDFVRQAKTFNNNIITIIGGVHAQLNYKRFYKSKVDYIARSEGMDAFIDLIKHIENKSSIDIQSINGVCYLNGDNYEENELTPIDINSLPIPDRSHFYKYKHKFRYLDLEGMATIKTAFSCPFACNFCYCTLLSGGKYSARDLNLVIEEIKNIDAKNIQIVDDDFLVDRERIIEFARLIRENNIDKTFICYARADFVAKNPDMVELLSDIGVRYFLVGLEAVNDTALNSYNKKTSDLINRQCVEIISKTKSDCIGLFIVNIDATKKDFEDIYNWVIKTNMKYVTVSIFTPIHGTPLYEENKHLITSDKIEDWDFLHLVMEPTKLSKFEFYRQYNKLFMRLYKIAAETGIYDFMDIKFYKKQLTSYLRRKMVGL